MAETTALTTTSPSALALPEQLSRTQIAILKDTVAKGTTDDELSFFLETCRYMRLNPFKKQVHCVVRNAGRENRTITIQVGIDGYRAMAEETGEYDGQVGPYWCGPDGQWHEIWLSDEHPVAAKVGIKRKGFGEPVWAIARWSAYVQTRGIWERGPNGRNVKVGEEPNEMWLRMGPEQLAKCAEALGLRKAFPQRLGGVYSDEEMAQANNSAPTGDPLAKAGADPWMLELREELSSRGQTLAAGVQPLIGDVKSAKDGVDKLRAWAKGLPEGSDPLDAAMTFLFPPLDMVDGESRELPEDEERFE